MENATGAASYYFLSMPVCPARESAAPAAVSRPERSDRVSEEAQYLPFLPTATGRADVTFCS